MAPRNHRFDDWPGRLPGSLAVALALSVLLGAGCAAAFTGGAEAVATTTVDLPKSYRFAPSAITVEAGTTVRWNNNDNFTHNVDLADDSGPPLSMAPGGTVSHTFPDAGTFTYVCSLHPNDMTGTVVVTPR